MPRPGLTEEQREEVHRLLTAPIKAKLDREKLKHHLELIDTLSDTVYKQLLTVRHLLETTTDHSDLDALEMLVTVQANDYNRLRLYVANFMPKLVDAKIQPNGSEQSGTGA